MRIRSEMSLAVLLCAALVLLACAPSQDAQQADAQEAGEQGEAAPKVIGTPIPEEDIAPPPAEVTELSNTFESVYDLANAVVQGINAQDPESNFQHALTESEFYWIVWPHLPASAPEVGMPWDWLWRDTNGKSQRSARIIADKYGGRDMRLLRVEFDGESSTYGPYKIHRDARCVVEMPDGTIQTLDLFGSVIELDGRFKAYSLLAD